MTQVVEHLCINCKALSSNHSTAKKKKKKKPEVKQILELPMKPDAGGSYL
jgi:hypothetical protein